jgi:two-component system LytT family response regulator
VAKINREKENLMAQQLNILFQKLKSQLLLQKIAFPTFQGFEVVPLDTIIRCEADNNYTYVFLKNHKKLLVSRTLKEIDEMLEGHPFLRIHQSHIVNLNEIVRYVRGEGGYVVMSDDTPVNVSRSRKDELFKIFS